MTTIWTPSSANAIARSSSRTPGASCRRNRWVVGHGRSGRSRTGEPMIIPVRCFTCGKVVGSSFPAFIERTRGGEEPRKVLDELGLKRYCCRRMILSHAELIDEVLPFG